MKEKTIIVNNTPFTYMDEVGDPYVFNSMSGDDMESILETTSELLSQCGVTFFLAFGTLLGSVREGYFIKGDDDVDIIVTDEKKLYNSLPYLWEHGLFINRIFEEELYTFHSEGKNGHIDMYILHPVDRWPYKNCVSIRGHYAPQKLFQGIDSNNYYIGKKSYPCPTNPENLLEWWYGKTWRIPQSRKATEDVLLRRLQLFPGECFRKGKRWIKRTIGLNDGKIKD